MSEELSRRGFLVVSGGPNHATAGAFDAVRRDFCNDIPVRTLRLAVPAGRRDMAALIGDGKVRSHPTYISVGGQRVAESSFIPDGTFAWVNFTLDGGATGREVDLEFASIEGEHWHLNALLMR